MNKNTHVIVASIIAIVLPTVNLSVNRKNDIEMKKGHTFKNMNRTYNSFRRNIHSINTLTSDIFVDHILPKDNTTQIEIIEVDPDEIECTPTLEKNSNFHHFWNNKDIAVKDTDTFKINHKARDKRRMKKGIRSENIPNITENDFSDIVTDFVYASIYGASDFAPSQSHHQSNWFTIINKPFNSSDSSSNDLENIEYTDTRNDYNWTDTDECKSDEIMTFDEDSENKRTVWVYSFNNKHILSENNIELINVPGQDSSDSTSSRSDNFSDDPESFLNKSAHRVSSPIPTTYIPRLNLLQSTLPTVTEITEPSICRQSKAIEPLATLNIRQKMNGWFDEDYSNLKLNKPQTENINARNIINWMSLSPRDRIRISRHTHINNKEQFNLPVVIETPPAKQSLNRPQKKSPAFNKIETVAEINRKDNTYVSKSNVKEELLLIDIDSEQYIAEESDFKILHKPHLLTSNNVKSVKITHPIEKLVANSWILEENNVGPQRDLTPKKDYCLVQNRTNYDQNSEVNCLGNYAGNTLWSQTMSPLKPPEWNKFTEITDTIPSLQLSVGTDTHKHSWLNSLVKCFRCFK